MHVHAYMLEWGVEWGGDGWVDSVGGWWVDSVGGWVGG